MLGHAQLAGCVPPFVPAVPVRCGALRPSGGGGMCALVNGIAPWAAAAVSRHRGLDWAARAGGFEELRLRRPCRARGGALAMSLLTSRDDSRRFETSSDDVARTCGAGSSARAVACAAQLVLGQLLRVADDVRRVQGFRRAGLARDHALHLRRHRCVSIERQATDRRIAGRSLLLIFEWRTCGIPSAHDAISRCRTRSHRNSVADCPGRAANAPGAA